MNKNRRNLRTQVLEDERLSKLHRLFRISKKISIERIANYLDMDILKLLTIIEENREWFKKFEIKDGFIIFISNKDISNFSDNLDKEFKSWDDNLHQKKGKD